MEKSNVEKVAEEVIEENKRLKMKLDDCNCQIREMQNHIDCLKADLAEAQGNKADFPNEPIKVAEMLIDASYSYKHILTGKEIENSLFSKSDLRQIAEHLLVYCNNSED